MQTPYRHRHKQSSSSTSSGSLPFEVRNYGESSSSSDVTRLEILATQAGKFLLNLNL